MQTTLTPVMGKKSQITSHSHDSVTTPLSGSFLPILNPLRKSINLHFCPESDSTASKLSTFSAGCAKASVQMRRTTNKKGKTAPAPPKRTRFVISYSFPPNSIEISHFLSPSDSLLSTNRDSTYREDDPRLLDEFHSNGTLAKSSSCSSFLIDVLFRGIYFRSIFNLTKSILDALLTHWICGLIFTQN